MIPRSPPKLTNRNSYISYLEISLWSWLKEVLTSLLTINFRENFQSFTVEDLTITAGTEMSIPNEFRNVYPGIIPSSRIIVRQQGDANIIDGPTTWTAKHVYLLNPSANDAKITVIFFK